MRTQCLFPDEENRKEKGFPLCPEGVTRGPSSPVERGSASPCHASSRPGERTGRIHKELRVPRFPGGPLGVHVPDASDGP